MLIDCAVPYVRHAARHLVRRMRWCVALGSERYIVAFRRSARAAFASKPMEATMERYVHHANIDHFQRLIAESKRDPARDEDRHAMLLTLLAEEIAKDKKAVQ